MKVKNVVFAVIWYVVIAVVAVALFIGNYFAQTYHSIISLTLQQAESKLEQVEGSEAVDSEYFKSSYTDEKKLREDGLALCEEIESEGMTLLENKGGLPLGKNQKVSLFGMCSANPVYGGTGSGSIDTSLAINPKAAFENAGYTVNETLWDFNVEKVNAGYKRTSASIEGNAGVEYKVNECPVSEYTTAVKNSFKDYSDAAIVFIGRSGGEGSDLSQTNTESGAGGYLALSPNEADLLSMIQESSEFDTIIVVINSSNSMELGWLQDYSKIKAALWVGSVGTSGFNAVAKAFTGEYNPSGRLVDTYAADSHSAPASVNFGNFSYTNAEELDDLQEPYFMSTQWTGKNYVVYQEGIYVGYRYYETRYEDCVLSQGNAASTAGTYASAGNWNYAEEVTYPFGYGLSYTSFAYEDFSVERNADGDYEVTVKVTNTGSVAGKEVVQVYLQSPYTDYDKANGIEKAAIELCGFAKTDVLDPDESEVVTVTVDETELRTYDANNAKTYIQDAGTYYLAVGANAHDALNNVLAAKGKTTADGMTANGDKDLAHSFRLNQDLVKFSKDADTNNPITNQFENAELQAYYPDLKYLSRNDWNGTYPEAVVLTATEELKEDLRRTVEDVVEEEEGSYTMPTTGKEGDLTLIMLKGAAYDDQHWEDLLDQMTVDEMLTLVSLGGYKTQAVPSVAYNGTIDKDGPQGISATLVGGSDFKCMAYTSEVVLAATWNEELVEEVGRMIGEDGIHAGVVGWYGPAMNTHRTPFTGRSFEYFSEDGFLAGRIGAAEVRGAKSMGMFTYIKHFAINDQDTNRKGLATFFSEQAAREIYLVPFEISVKEGGSNAVMTSHNRIGAIWAAGSANLNINVLRTEWGFVGHCVSDYVGTPVYQNTAQAVIAGNDMMLATNQKCKDSIEIYKDNAFVMTRVREACHNILYSAVNSAAMNGIDQNTRVVPVTPAWQYWLLTLNIVMGVVLVGGVVLTTYLNFFKKNAKAKQ